VPPLAACSASPDSGDSLSGAFSTAPGDESSGVTSNDPGDSASSGGEDAGTSTGADDEDTGSDGGPILDTLPSETGTAEGGDGEGCDFVDLLFIIDNSISMGLHQEGLAAAFPGFVDEMLASLPPDTDLHVGITTTSFSVTASACSETTANCGSSGSEADILAAYDLPGSLDNGENGGQGRLFEHEGKRYFQINSDDDPAALKAWFTSAAVAAGEDGCSFEMPAASAGWALAPENESTNTGFLRDEGAALMIFVVTDEPDKSPGLVDEHVQRVLAAKTMCGGADCIVAGGLMPEQCYEHEADMSLYEFMNAFGEEPVIGFLPLFTLPGSPPPDYSGVLGAGLAQVLTEACAGIPPVG
jgi:hypothetical protein